MDTDVGAKLESAREVMGSIVKELERRNSFRALKDMKMSNNELYDKIKTYVQA